MVRSIGRSTLGKVRRGVRVMSLWIESPLIPTKLTQTSAPSSFSLSSSCPLQLANRLISADALGLGLAGGRIALAVPLVVVAVTVRRVKSHALDAILGLLVVNRHAVGIRARLHARVRPVTSSLLTQRW